MSALQVMTSVQRCPTLAGQSPQPSAQLVRHSSKSKRRARCASEKQQRTEQVLQYQFALPVAACDPISDSEILFTISQQAGAEVRLAETASGVQGWTSYVIRGGRTEIEAAFQLLCQKTGLQGTIASQAQEFWLEWMKNSYPDLHSQAYFLPAVFVRRVPVTRQELAGHGVLVPDEGIMISDASRKVPEGQPPPVYGSDVRDDEAMERVYVSLKRLAQEHDEVFMCVSELGFKEYLSHPSYAAAAAHLPRPACLPASIPPKWCRGDFDVLIIHRQYGLVVCEVKAFGGNMKELNMSQQDMDQLIRHKMRKACYQLKKAEVILSHLVSDIAPGLRITKVIALPNMTSFRVSQALKDDSKLAQELCQCLKVKDAAGIARFCLCSDNLPASAPLSGSMFEIVWRVWDWWHGRVAGTKQEHMLSQLWRWWQGIVADALPEYWRQLPNWWRRGATESEAEPQHKDQMWKWWQECVASGGPDPVMASTLYEILVARFCGPATTVSVPCTTPPRLSMKTQGHAVSVTGECYTAPIALFPEQVNLLHQAPARVFLAGPPGTGKTVVLLLMGTEWLALDTVVYVVSTWNSSRVACRMLHHLLLQEAGSLRAGRLHYLQYDLTDRKGVEGAVNDLAAKAVDESLHVIADDAGPDYWQDSQPFSEFCEELLKRVPGLRLWAASCQHRHTPVSWEKDCFTRPLRCPPVVVREVAQAPHMARYDIVTQYSRRGVPDHTEGPPIKWVFHRGMEHPGLQPIDCDRCGEEVACFLRYLSIGRNSFLPATDVTSISCATAADVSCPPGLQYKDVLLLCWGDPRDTMGLVRSLAKADFPVRVMRGDDEVDVATARSDVVWVAQGDRVRGVERKVVVAVGHNVPRLRGIYHRLDWISRCTSQLVWVVPLPSDVDISCLPRQ